MFKVIGQHDENTIEQAKRVLACGADHFVLCADGHLGYGHPIGGVALYKDRVSLSGVGFDIACGNKAVKLGIKYEEIKYRLEDIAKGIQRKVSFGIGRPNKTKVEAEFLDTDANWNNPAIIGLKDLAAEQLGTVGGGNHFVDVFYDEEGYVWIGVHFGSRGLGHKATTYFLKQLNAKDDMTAEPTIVDINSSIGQEYVEAMILGGKYAYAGRDWVVDAVAREVTGLIHNNYLEEIHNHHNYSWIEEHDGEKYHVVRKGSTPAFPNQKGFIGGSMLAQSVIISGMDTPQAKENFYSTVHGAGRVISRRQAAGKTKWQNGRRIQVTEGCVNEQEMRQKAKELGVVLLGAGPDEAPQCYKNLDEVLTYHQDSVKIEHRLTPCIVLMAGANDFDPYKD